MSLHKDMKFVVKWVTKDGKHYTKVYDDYRLAQKAAKWLLDQGNVSVDVAVRLPRKETDTDA